MPTSRHGFTYLVQGQGSHDIVVNTDLDDIDKALNGYLTQSVAGGIDVTITATNWNNRIIEFTGTITANINVIVPITTRLFAAYNNTTGAFSLTVKTASGTGITVPQGNRVILACDGTNVVSVTAGAVGDAVANGSTKGIASFVAADFNDDGSGIISLDYTNAQAASGSNKGFLTSADWTTFNNKVGATDTQTLTNKRITRRVVTLTDAATVTPDCDTTDLGILTSLSQTTTLANPTGTPTDGQFLQIRVKSSAAQNWTFGSQYRGSDDQALPTATSGGNKTDYMGFQFNSADTKWDYVAKNFGF